MDRAKENMTSEDYSAWFRGKDLTTDWTSRYYPIWASLLGSRRNEPLTVLEIGSWEGRSAIFFLRYLPNCRLTCIDTFAGSAEHLTVEKWRVAVPHIEARFDANVAEFGDRVVKLKSRSMQALARLLLQGAQFDLVYIDGSHRSADVQSDATLSWPMVKNHGIVVFDDYDWSLMGTEMDRPKLGVDTFLRVRAGEYRELHRGYQLIVEKI